MKRSSAIALAAGALAGGSLALLSQRKRSARALLRITDPGGIDQEEYVYIGGIEQCLYHRGRDVSNPVMLFLHGGPGSPELPFLHRFQIPWEDRVTVVHWEQRGAGKTYFRSHAPGYGADMTLERLIEDTDEIVSYLKRKYRTDQVILMGHSWGTVLGTSYIKRYPASVLAYIGVGQVVNAVENERVAFAKVLEAAQAAGSVGDEAALRALEPYPGGFSDFLDKVGAVRRYQCKYGLATGYTWENAKTVLGSPFYSLWESTYFLRPGCAKRQARLMEDLFAYDLPALGLQYRVPFYLIHGEQDWQTPYPLAEAYFSDVQAPEKAFYPIRDGGHFTMFDQRERFDGAFYEILDRVSAQSGAAGPQRDQFVERGDTEKN